MAIQVQVPEQSAEVMALSCHCLCMEPVVTTFPLLGALFGSYGQAHRTSSLQDHTQTSHRAHDTVCYMLGSLRLSSCKTKGHRNVFSPQQTVGESKSHAHSHIQFPPTARSSLGKNAQIIPGLPTTTLNLFCLYSSLAYCFTSIYPSLHPSSGNSITLQGLLISSFLQPAREIRMGSTSFTIHGRAFLTRQLVRIARKHECNKETTLFFTQC